MNFSIHLVVPLLGLVLAPLLSGIARRVQAWFAGRRGAPLMQGYFDIWKLMRKGTVYGKETSWMFQAGPIVYLAAMITGLFLVPFANLRAPAGFNGDLILLIALLALARFFMVLAAFDSGSTTEELGGNRVLRYSPLIEPALILGLVAVARISIGSLSLSLIHERVTFALWMESGLILTLAAGSLAIVVICENSQKPVNDPEMAEELDMVQQALTQGHSGPDLAFAIYATFLKQWLLSALLLNVIIPSQTHSLVPIDFFSVTVDTVAMLCGMVLLAMVSGCVGSMLARIRVNRIPQLLIGATAVAALALALTIHPEQPADEAVVYLERTGSSDRLELKEPRPQS